MISTIQAATFFPDACSPNKRASQLLKEMEEEGLIEGKRRLDKPKVWRLSKKGREIMKVSKKPVPFTSRKVEHHLAVCHVLLQLRKRGKVSAFEHEPRERYGAPTGSRMYCPDAYFIFNNRAYLLEVQLSAMSSTQWAHKWSSAQKALERVKWEREPTKIVVLSKQQRETVGGFRLPLLVMPTIEEFTKWEAWARL